MGVIHDIRFERLAREAADRLVPLCPEDRAYVLAHLAAVEDAFGVRAVPDVPLRHMTGRALARHLARLRPQLAPQGLEQELALGRLEGVFRLVAAAVRLGALSPRRRA